MINYDPLFQTLERKGWKLIDLERRCEFSSRTTRKFRKNESVTLTTIARICKELEVPIEEVVRIDYDK